MDADTGLDEAGLKHMRGIRRILRFLATDPRIAHMHGRATVFGSAAAGKAKPGDVDVLIDFSDHAGGTLHPGCVDGNGLLLAVGRQFYGSFDPFVLVGDLLYARDEASQGWIEAKRARAILAAARRDGRPPADVLAEIRARPATHGGVAPKAAEPPAPPGP